MNFIKTSCLQYSLACLDVGHNIVNKVNHPFKCFARAEFLFQNGFSKAVLPNISKFNIVKVIAIIGSLSSITALALWIFKKNDSKNLKSPQSEPSQLDHNPFLALPQEVLLNILINLDPRNLGRTSQTCRSLKSLSEDDSLWKHLFQTSFFFTGKGLIPPSPSETYLQICQRYLSKVKRIENGAYLNNIWKDQNSASAGPLTVFNGFLYSASGDRTIKKWDEDGNCIQTLQGHRNCINALTVFNGFLYSASGDRTIKKWDEDGNCIQTLKGHTSGVNSLKVFNGFLYSGSGERTIKKWDEDGNCIQTLKGHTSGVNSLKVFNGFLYSGSGYCTIKKWNEQDICVQTLQGHTYSINALTVFNGFLYSGSGDRTIKKWDEDGNCIQTLKGHTYSIFALTVFNGFLYSGSWDGTIKKWDEDGNCIQTLEGHTSGVNSLKVFNGFLYSGSMDRTIRIRV